MFINIPCLEPFTHNYGTQLFKSFGLCSFNYINTLKILICHPLTLIEGFITHTTVGSVWTTTNQIPRSISLRVQAVITKERLSLTTESTTSSHRAIRATATFDTTSPVQSAEQTHGTAFQEAVLRMAEATNQHGRTQMPTAKVNREITRWGTSLIEQWKITYNPDEPVGDETSVTVVVKKHPGEFIHQEDNVPVDTVPDDVLEEARLIFDSAATTIQVHNN